MVYEICGSYKIPYQVSDDEKAVEVDFTPPFARISMVEGVESAGGFEIPRPLDSDEALQFLLAKCGELGLNLPANARNCAKLLDKVWSNCAHI